jgi:hypothetical protein
VSEDQSDKKQAKKETINFEPSLAFEYALTSFSKNIFISKHVSSACTIEQRRGMELRNYGKEAI